MRKTFVCDDTMIITIPIGRLRNASEGQLLPDKFHCVFKDCYKVLVHKGKPRAVGAAQAMMGLFLLTLGLIPKDNSTMKYTLPSVLFVVSGLITYAAGKYPNMHVTKLSFCLNIISFFWSAVAFNLCLFVFHEPSATEITKGIKGVIVSLLVVENMSNLFLIYWLSTAVCKQGFNKLPTILLKHAE